jgi:hypothetical protein
MHWHPAALYHARIESHATLWGAWSEMDAPVPANLVHFRWPHVDVINKARNEPLPNLLVSQQGWPQSYLFVARRQSAGCCTSETISVFLFKNYLRLQQG